MGGHGPPRISDPRTTYCTITYPINPPTSPIVCRTMFVVWNVPCNASRVIEPTCCALDTPYNACEYACFGKRMHFG